MTRMMLLTISAAALALPAIAFAEPAPSRSAAQIVCELTGDCSGVPGGQRSKLPGEAAFSFTRPADGKAVKASAAKPARAGRAPVRTAAAATPVRASGIDMRIAFDNGSAEMTPQGRVEAEQFAKAMAMPQLSGHRFAVEGHTNAVGDRAYNMNLSQRRAAAVSAYLVSLGVDQSRLDARGVGFDKPLPGSNAAAPVNRRVQFVPLS